MAYKFGRLEVWQLAVDYIDLMALPTSAGQRHFWTQIGRIRRKSAFTPALLRSAVQGSALHLPWRAVPGSASSFLRRLNNNPVQARRADLIYKVGEALPRNEEYNLKSQITRAAYSRRNFDCLEHCRGIDRSKRCRAEPLSGYGIAFVD